MNSGPWENRYSALVESAGDAILIVDFETAHFIEANHAACALFGYSVDEFRERTGRMLHPPGADQSVDRLSRRLVDEGRASSPDVRCQRKDGTLFWAEIRSTCYLSEGRKFYVAIVRNVSERVEREDKLEAANDALKRMNAQLMHSSKLAAVGELAAGVAHEVNNPAAFVLLNLESVRAQIAAMRKQQNGSPATDDAFAEIDEVLQETVDGVQRIVAIVRALRGLSQPNDGNIKAVAISDIIHVACNMAHTKVRHRAKLALDLAQLPKISGDGVQLSQVVLNLLLNAAEAIEEGTAKRNQIRIATQRRGEGIAISVSDTGSGIKANVRERVFDPFVTTKAETGQGLGLSLCADIVQRHGGNIQVARTSRDGTQIDVWLPFDTNLNLSTRPPPANSPRRIARGAPRILIIDDELPLLRAYKRAFGKQYDLVMASGGAEALGILAQDQRFDVVLCDVMMPDVDGVSLHEVLVREMPEVASRTVFCTGGVFSTRAEEYIATVDNPCVQKPLDLRMLEELVSKLSQN